MVFRSVGNRREVNAVEALGHSEDAFGHAVDFEISFDFVFVEGIFLAAHFLGVVIVVPRLDGDFIAEVVGESLHFGNLFVDALDCRAPDLHKQVLGVLRGLGHDVGGHVGGVVGIAEQLGLGGAGLDDFSDDGIVVILSRRGLRSVGFVDLAAKVAVVGELENRQTARGMECEDPLAVEPALFGLVGGQGDCRLRQSREHCGIVNNELIGVGGFQKIAVELRVKFGQAVVELFEFFLVGCREQGAVAGEVAVAFLDGAKARAAQTELGAVVVEIFDALEEFVVHHDVVDCRPVEQHCLVGDFLKLGVAVGLAERHEHTHNAGCQLAALLHGEDGVVERGRGLLIGDGIDFSAVDFQPFFESGHVVGRCDAVERRNVVGRVVRLEERVVPFGGHAADNGDCHGSHQCESFKHCV